jgi:hypothetical protein
MPAKTYTFAAAVTDHFLRHASQASPTTIYAALFTAAPTQSGGGTEVSGGSYARVAITFGAASSGVCANTDVVTFPTASGAWGTLTAMGIFDASTGGNLLYYGALGTPKAVTTGDVAAFGVGALSVTEQ